MIEASQIDEYIEMWNDNLLGTDGLIDLVFALIEDREMLSRKHRAITGRVKRLENALMTCAQTAGDDPFFNEGGEGYEALFGGEEE